MVSGMNINRHLIYTVLLLLSSCASNLNDDWENMDYSRNIKSTAGTCGDNIDSCSVGGSGLGHR